MCYERYAQHTVYQYLAGLSTFDSELSSNAVLLMRLHLW